MRATRSSVAVLAIGAALVALLAGPAKPDDAGVRAGRNDTFVVRGQDGALGPSGADGGEAGCVGNCPRTVLTPVCPPNRWGVLPQPGSGVTCLEVPLCPAGQVGRQVWTEEGVGWRPGPRICVAEADSVPVASIATVAVDRVRHRVPVPDPARQPRRRALVSLPVILDSGQPGGQRVWTDEIAGFTVTTTVSPSWVWTFGDGQTLATTTPGSRYPDLAVSHEYQSPGDYRIRLTTTWDGSFTIAGAGTFPILGEVTQEAELGVTVVEARAVLVPQSSRTLGR